MMKIIIGGGTGLVGQVLVPELIAVGHEVYVIGRNEHKIQKIFATTVNAITWDKLDTLNPDEFGAIINLCGENIAEHRWTAKIQNKLLSSRIDATRNFVVWASNAKNQKPHLYNASAIGIYGLQNKLPADENEAFTESSNYIDPKAPSFSNQLVMQWEQEALQGTEAHMSVTLMRFGVVLKRGEGMLKKLELPAQYGMGAVIGTGQQPISWIDHVDLVNAILFLINNPEIVGPINLVAPEYVTQKTFTKTLAQVLKKPALLRLPAWLVTILFGQMGTELLLSGQAVMPQRLIDHQFSFKYPTLITALKKEFEPG